MPASNAFLRSATDLHSSTSPHQPVETVQTPKPTSETSMPVLPSLRYLISHLSSWVTAWQLSVWLLHSSARQRGNLLKSAHPQTCAKHAREPLTAGVPEARRTHRRRCQALTQRRCVVQALREIG